jgi:hypothetical protein
LLDDYLLCQHPGGVLAPEYHSCPETYGWRCHSYFHGILPAKNFQTVKATWRETGVTLRHFWKDNDIHKAVKDTCFLPWDHSLQHEKCVKAAQPPVSLSLPEIWGACICSEQ